MTEYPASTRPLKPADIVNRQRPRSKGDTPRWIMRIKFLFYRVVRPFVRAEIDNSLWEDKQAN